MKVQELTPEQEATIDQRLDQAGAFMQDVLDDPAILNDIPDGSVLRFSNVTIGDVDFRLTAYADSNASHDWTARVTGPAEWAAEGRMPFRATPNGVGGKRGEPPHSILSMGALQMKHSRCWKKNCVIHEVGLKPRAALGEKAPDIRHQARRFTCLRLPSVAARPIV